MAINVDKLLETFFEEAQEHLLVIENALLSFDVEQPDLELINSVFRGVHSIKGGAGIFQLDVLVDVAHIMESILDRARNQQLEIVNDTVTLLLETNDILRTMLNNYSSGGDIESQDVEEICKRLQFCLSSSESAPIIDDKADYPKSDNEACEEFSTLTEQSPWVETLLDDPSLEFGFNGTDPESGPQESDNQDIKEAFGFFEDTEKSTDSDEKHHEFGFFEEHNGNKNEKNAEFGFFSEEPKLAIAPKSSTNSLQPKKNAKKVNSPISCSIRVDTQKIDSLVNLVGELVITQSILQVIGNEVTGKARLKLQTAVAELKRNTREIQDSVMSMRMLPIGNTFERFPRVARDLSKQLNKKIELHITGGSTEIDKGMIEKLVDPLTHLVRNSIDHGIEKPEQRIRNGKPEKGHITLSAEQKGGNILINVIDDGAGLNRNKIIQKATENGISCHGDMTDQKVWELIFEPGFSTAESVTDVSGRGVGMDVVRRNIESIGGRIEIDSTPGKGSVFQIQLPLTLAILDGMCVTVGEQVYVIPLSNIIESLQPSSSQIKEMAHDRLLWIRDQYWPLISLAEFMNCSDEAISPENGVIVLVQTNKKRFGIIVNNLVGQQQVVIKSLEKHYKRVSGIAGATIMGNGSVALILDIESIAEGSRFSVPEPKEEMAV